jgi:dipeptidyl aminopeptidase/acylaminoacyl peptidase
MRTARLTCATLVLSASVALAGAEKTAGPADASGRWTPDYAFEVKRVSSVRVSPDGSRVAFVVAVPDVEGEKSEWVAQVHVARADGSSSFQLTRGEKSATSPEWSPDGRTIAFLSARGPEKDGKDPKAGLWRVAVDGGEAEPLTDEKSAITSFRFSPDGRSIAFLMADARTDEEEKADKEKRDARVVDDALKMIRLRVVPVEKDAEGKRPVRTLTSGEFSVGNIGSPAGFDWSPDGRTIAFTHQPNPHINDWPLSDVSLVDVATGAVRPLAATRASESEPFFSPDGRSVAIDVTDDPPTWRGRSRVAVVPAGGGAPRLLAATKDERPNLIGWTRDGRVLVSETLRTVNRLFALPTDGGPAVALGPAEVMVDGAALNAAGTHVGFSSQAPDQAPEAYVARVDAFTPARVSRVQDLPPVPLGRTEVVTWKAPDGREVEGLLTYPTAYQAGRRVPLLVIVHGGPAGVFVRSFVGSATPYPVAGFATRGYAVLRVNPRGSSGYGADFRHANYRDWGLGDYQDIMSGVDAVIARGVGDPDRLGIMGWSYGGYMTSWVITRTRRFKAASVGAGVTNLMSFTGTADIPGFIPDYFGGEFWDEGGLERWRRHSAMFNVKGVSTPTLIQHGEQDLRVPISQGYELYNALKRQKVPVAMVVYPRTPHGIQEPKLVRDALTRNLEWFDRWVLERPAEATSARR